MTQVKGRVTTPTIRITDKRFQYVRSEHTDLARTFRIAREKLRKER